MDRTDRLDRQTKKRYRVRNKEREGNQLAKGTVGEGKIARGGGERSYKGRLEKEIEGEKESDRERMRDREKGRD